jgi:hypothetical protein
VSPRHGGVVSGFGSTPSDAFACWVMEVGCGQRWVEVMLHFVGCLRAQLMTAWPHMTWWCGEWLH